MWAKVLGAAAVAWLGAYALVGEARASGIYETIRIDTDQGAGHRGYLFFHSGELASFSSDLVGQLTYHDGGGQSEDFSLFSQSGDLSYSLTPDALGGADFHLTAGAVGHTIYTYCDQFACGPVYNDIDIESLDVTTNQALSYGTSFSISGSDITSSSNYTLLFQDGYDTAFQGNFGTVTGVSVQVFPAPLPSSLPMMGAALFGLGCASYVGRRRRRS